MNCDFHLPKRCSEIPQKPNTCYEICSDFVYHCFKCFFGLHLLCGDLTETEFERKSHNTSIDEALFFCNGCLTEQDFVVCGVFGFTKIALRCREESITATVTILSHFRIISPKFFFPIIYYRSYSLHSHFCSLGCDYFSP